MISRVTYNMDVQLPMVRLVKVNSTLVKAELDTRAQVSLIGGSLSRKLGLKLRTLNNYLHFNGINSTGHELKSDSHTDLKMELSNQETSVTYFVINRTRLRQRSDVWLRFYLNNITKFVLFFDTFKINF